MKYQELFPWFQWSIAVSFFAFQFILRLLPGLIMPQVMSKFQIDASSYGLLSSMYYFGYAGAQLPVAFLLDRFGPRKVISGCILLCASSTFILAHTSYWPALLAGRFLIGVGSAAGFLGTAKVASQWFKSENYARMLGITFSFGLMGALYGGKPVASWITKFGWESVTDRVGFFGMALSAIAILFLKSGQSAIDVRPKGADLRGLFSNGKLFLLGVCNLLMVGTLEGFADVWGVPYLTQTFSISQEDAAFHTSMIFMGMLFGGPILAFLAEKSKRFFEVTAGAGVASAGLMLVLLFLCESFHSSQMVALFFLLGILCCYQVLILSIGSKAVPKSMLGITTAFLNCINMAGGAFFHGSIGLLLDLQWTEAVTDGVRHYSTESFRMALLVIPIASILGALGVLIVRKLMPEEA